MVDGLCGSDTEAQSVKTKTAEEFYFWLARKIKLARKAAAEANKKKKK